MSIFYNSFEICDCDCHKNYGLQMKHIMACCTKCEVCGKRIKNGAMKGHYEHEHNDRKKNRKLKE